MEYNIKDNPRFRSLNGKIRGTKPRPVLSPKMTTTDARKMLNEFYVELCKYDTEKAEDICGRHNA